MQQQVLIPSLLELTVGYWAHKMADEICFSDEYAALPDADKQSYLINKGYPKELFSEPLSFLFASKVGNTIVNMYIRDLFEVTVLQTVKEEHKTNMFVQFMRGLTWSSFENYLRTTHLFVGLGGIVHAALTQKKPPVIPFWFRNFNKQAVKEHVYKTIDKISSALIKADYFLVKYKNEKVEHVKQEKQYPTGTQSQKSNQMSAV